MRLSDRVATALAVVLTSMLSGGCSTYVGNKVAPDGKLPVGSTGIPYSMTRPEYVVDIGADGDDPSKPVYTLRVKDVPDVNQKYTLALDPALLTDGKFDFTLGENGNLSEANATLDSRVVATIKAVAGFAANLISISAKKDEASDLALYRKTLLGSTAPSCKAIETVRKGERTTVAQVIDADLGSLFKRAELVKAGSGATATLQQYYYRSLAQRACLAAVREEIFAREDRKLKDAETAFHKATPPKTITLDDQHTTVLKAVPGWVESDDKESISRALAYVATLGDAKSADLNTYLEAARDYVTIKLASAGTKAMAQLFDMGPAMWRARNVKHLESEIDRKRLELQLAPQGLREPLLSEISVLEDQRAESIGGRELLRRIQRIDLFLADVRKVSGPDRQSRYAADEHVKMRVERDFLQAQLDQFRLSTLSSADKSAAAKVAPRSDVQVRIVKRQLIDDVNAKTSVVFDNLPEYALVLEPLDRTVPLIKTSGEAK